MQGKASAMQSFPSIFKTMAGSLHDLVVLKKKKDANFRATEMLGLRHL
jgi:hypothetical protein